MPKLIQLKLHGFERNAEGIKCVKSTEKFIQTMWGLFETDTI